MQQNAKAKKKKNEKVQTKPLEEKRRGWLGVGWADKQHQGQVWWVGRAGYIMFGRKVLFHCPHHLATSPHLNCMLLFGRETPKNKPSPGSFPRECNETNWGNIWVCIRFGHWLRLGEAWGRDGEGWEKSSLFSAQMQKETAKSACTKSTKESKNCLEIEGNASNVTTHPILPNNTTTTNEPPSPPPPPIHPPPQNVSVLSFLPLLPSSPPSTCLPIAVKCKIRGRATATGHKAPQRTSLFLSLHCPPQGTRK